MSEVARSPQAPRNPLRRLGPAHVIALTIALCGSVFAIQKQSAEPALQGRELAKRVLKAQETSGFQIRARVILGDDTDEARRPVILQVRIAGRRENGRQKVLYQVFWPTSLKGYAAVIEQGQGPEVSGFVFEPPDRVTPLAPAVLRSSFAGSGLTLEDLAENFWRWPRQRVTGQGQAGKQACTVLESQPSPDLDTAYASVRSCVDTKKATPLWVEKYGADGKLVKRISFETPDRKNRDQDFRVSMVVDGSPYVPRTRVEILKSDRGIKISPDEFSLERLKSLVSKLPLILP